MGYSRLNTSRRREDVANSWQLRRHPRAKHVHGLSSDGGARDQEVGDVDAGDREAERGRAKQRDHPQPDRPYAVIAE